MKKNLPYRLLTSVSFARPGSTIAESAMLRSQGYLKTTSIRQLDDSLNTLCQQAFDDGKIDQETRTMMQNLKYNRSDD